LTHIGLPSLLEPNGLTMDKRPNGLTLNPWYKGRSLVWDVTVVDTFAESHYVVSVATDAEADKCQKYNDLLDNYYFQPVAIETTGVWQVHCPFLELSCK